MKDGHETSTDQTLEVDGLTVHFQHRGRGPALVLVHGLLAYSFSWRLVLPEMAKSREVFALDMPGSGNSQCDPHLDSRLAAAARRLSRILDAVGVDICDLVGSSYGGATALRFATLEPARVRTLTLVSPANPWSNIGRKRLFLLGVPGIGDVFPGMARLSEPFLPFFLGRMYGDPARITSETLTGYALPLQRTGVLEHALKITRSWHGDMRELLSELPKAAEIPTLILWGSKDRVVDPKSAEPLAGQFRNATITTLKGAGHIPYEECPEEFMRCLKAFLNLYSPAQVLDGK
jgi:pimeloyl-ACP methyl ester carboxylesterase